MKNSHNGPKRAKNYDNDNFESIFKYQKNNILYRHAMGKLLQIQFRTTFPKFV